jgi:hypothetical protein
MEPLKKFFFKYCPISGNIVGFNRKNIFLKIIFPFWGIAALVWFLIRVVPKPNRINYPCQKVAAPIVFSLISYMISSLGLVFLYRGTNLLLKQGSCEPAFFQTWVFMNTGTILRTNNTAEI